MMRQGQLVSELHVGRALTVLLYTFFIMLVQVHVVARLPYQALRTDLLLPLLIAAAVGWSPLPGLAWAAFWGFLADNFSGQLWGLHVCSYAVAVCLVHLASDRFDCYNPIYQAFLAGICVLGQSIAIGLYLSFVPQDLPTLTDIWISLGIRTVLCMTLTPLLVYPIFIPRSSY